MAADNILPLSVDLKSRLNKSLLLIFSSFSRLSIKLLTKVIFTSLFSLSGLVAAFFLSWLILAQANFAYGSLHDFLDIEQVSQIYGPQNNHRNDFELTDKKEKVRLFAAINTSIHQQGEGLADIQYHHPDGKVIDSFLHQAEIVHLQDVANLIEVLKSLAIIVSLVWLLSLPVFRIMHIAMPSLKQQLIYIGSVMSAVALLIVVMGPVKIFYALHEWVFPVGHQWFFYYQDSLMSTLMKAPDLFGAIALLLTVLALLIFVLLYWLGQLGSE